MSEEASTATGTETAATTQTTAPETNTTAAEITTVDQLPEFAKKMISDLRSEAAKHRSGKGEAVEATRAEVTQGFEAKLAESNTAHEATKGTLAAEQLKLAKVLATIDAGVPTDKVRAIASRLQGSTPEELAADAKQVLGLLGVNSAVDPSQGRGAGGAPGDGSGDDFAAFIMSKLDKN